MNAHSQIRTRCLATIACLTALTSHIVYGQVYVITKGQVFTQTSNAGAVADPIAPFSFSVLTTTSTILTLPSGSTQATTFVPDDNSFEVNLAFTSKAALDAAFPNGTYRMTGTGISALSFNLTTEQYPSVTPSVTNGTWNSGGLLVIDPTQTATINFSTFTGYATSGVAGSMQVKVQGLNDNVNIGGAHNSGIFSVANPFGVTVQSAPLTSIAIPAGTLTSGRVYQGSISFGTATTLDLTTVSGGAAVASFGKVLNFYIAAQAPGTSTPPPVITSQLASQVGVAGGSATFSIGLTVGGSNPNQSNSVTVTWYFNGQPINFNGTKYTNNGFGFTINNLTAADAGNYSVTLINAGGIAVSAPATLTLGTAAAPTITRQPLSRTVAQGSTAVFSVAASGGSALTYQWQFNGTSLAGQTGPLLLLQNVGPAQAGDYTVVVAAGNANVASAVANLTVVTTNDPGRLTNLSVLTDISVAVPSFTVGTVIGGVGTGGTKPLVVRVGGPSLGALGVPGTIADPQLALFNSASVQIAANDNWGTPVGAGAAASATLLSAMASVGAFPYTGPTSLDAAVFQSGLSPGGYTVVASGNNGSVGTAIAEIYDATPAGTFTPTSPRLINVSVLKQIASGGSLTLGFTIGGSTAKTVLIRVIGPGLAAVGLTSGTLGDPQLTLFNSSSSVLTSNDDWGASPVLINTASRVNAFSVGNQPTKDSMLLLTLPAGGYTAQATGNNGTSGLAIVEVYEVP